MIMLEVNNVSKSFLQGNAPLPILKNLNLQVNEAETIAVLGQSGCGKSTLLALLAGLDKADSGWIKVLGQNLADLNEEQLTHYRAKHLSIVFQQFHLMPHLTAIENVALPLQLLGRAHAFEIAELYLKKVLLTDRLLFFPGQLSGGECQRVAIARALAVEPSVLLADEPSGNLDPKTGEQVVQMLFELAANLKNSMVVVTHNYDLARRCNKIYQLSDGNLKLITL